MNNWNYLLAVWAICFCVQTAPAQRIRAMPADQVPYQNLAPSYAAGISPQAYHRNIDRLRRQKPKIYLLDAGDVLGIFVEGVLGELDSNPPVHMPPPGSDVPPSMGYPIVVRADGTISLPLVDPISVRGLSISQAEERIKAVYLGNNKNGDAILTETNRIIVSLHRKRTINVTVIRQDNSRSFYSQPSTNRRSVTDRSDRSARSSNLQLSSDDNDVLNALIATGGIPGVNAQPNVRVLRADRGTNSEFTDGYSTDFAAGSQSLFPRSGQQSPTSQHNSTLQRARHNSYRVPLGFSQPSNNYRPTNQGSRLNEGDIVVVQSKPTEVFYTGGLLRGGEYPIPRDKSLNVLEAISVAGGSVGAQNTSLVSGFSQLPPTELIIIRNSPQYGQLNIRVDINRAIQNPSQRLQVAPGDTLILRHSAGERAGNFGIQTINAYGVYRLLN